MSNGQHASPPTLDGQPGLVERVSEIRATRPQAIAEVVGLLGAWLAVGVTHVLRRTGLPS